jgi:hypothetical protein
MVGLRVFPLDRLDEWRKRRPGFTLDCLRDRPSQLVAVARILPQDVVDLADESGLVVQVVRLVARLRSAGRLTLTSFR